ncbi:hypothetical protein OLQ22_05980 [Campylobacter jejuni]|nr:hypothetical protein [Campylobacter jejuni]
MNRINIFLENLNPRERILYFILIIFAGVFLALKLSETYLENDNNDEALQLLLQNSQSKSEQLNQKLLSLNAKYQNQSEELFNLKQGLLILKKSYNDYMNALQKKANENSLYFKDLDTQTTKMEQFQIHHLKINFQSSFVQLLSFLQDLNNDKHFFSIEKLNIQSKEEYLDITLKLNFIVLDPLIEL